jgi:uncharacterized membrane protein
MFMMAKLEKGFYALHLLEFGLFLLVANCFAQTKDLTMRYARFLFMTVILICILEAVRLWFLAPDQMAAHFNAQGNPDHYVSKLTFFADQLQTVLIVIVSGIVLQILPMLLPAEWINIRNREYWLAPERRQATMGRLSSFGAIFFSITLAVIQIGFELAVYASLQQPVAFATQIMIPVIIAFFVLSFGLVFWLSRSFRNPS